MRGLRADGEQLQATGAPGVDVVLFQGAGIQQLRQEQPDEFAAGADDRREVREPECGCRVQSVSCRHAGAGGGLEGIRENLDPGEAQEENLYEWPPEKLEEHGICELPRTLDEAVDAFEADPFVGEVLGPELRREFITYKREEWRQYHQRVSQWEIDTYARLY